MSRARRVALPTGINWADSEASGLVACFMTTPGGMMDLVRGVVGTRVGTADPTRSTELGTLESYFDGNGDNWNFGSGALVSTTAPFTIAWEAYLDSLVDVYPSVAVIPTSSANNELELVYSNQAGSNDITFGSSTAWVGGGKALLTNGMTRTGMRHWGALTFDGVSATTLSSFRLYVNGVELTIAASGAYLSRGDDTARIGGNATNALLDWNGGIRQVRVYDREWTHGDAIRFFNPATRDSLFSRTRFPYRFGMSSAGGFKAAWATQRSGSIGAGRGY